MPDSIGIMTGTFDPPHRGHLEIVERAIAELRLDFCFVVTNAATHHKPQASGYADRQQMASLFFGHHPRIIVGADYLQQKMALGGVDQMINALSRRFAARRLYRILGEDSFVGLRPQIQEALPKNVFFAVFPRQTDGQTLTRLRAGGGDRLLVMDRVHVTSSTSVRCDIRHGKQSSHLSDGVRRYIDSKCLYESTAS